MKTNKIKLETKDIALNAIIAALYFALTMFFAPISFNAIQVRVSEALLLVLLIDRKYSVGLIVGCLIANMFSPLGIYDIAFGTIATALTCYAMNRTNNMALKFIWPAILNGIIVGLELTILFEGTPFILNAIYVAIGEIISVFLPGMLFKDKIIKLGQSKPFTS